MVTCASPADLRASVQRRTLRVLVAAQLLAALGGSGAVAGALLGLELTGSAGLASLPLALLVVGSTAAVLPVAALSRRAGRRVGLVAALALAAAGAAGVVAAGALRSFPLLLAAHAAFGAGNAAVMLARYAAADLSTPGERGRAIGIVVFAATFGGVAGPNLLAPAGDAAAALGLPPLTGLYLFAAAAFALAAALLAVLLRPDPLHLAIRLAVPDATPDARPARRPLRDVLAPSGAAAGLATIVTANLVMVAVMAMAPVHLERQGHGLELVGLLVSLHVAGMFAPAPLSGRLADRFGPLPVATGGAALLAAGGTLAGAGLGAPVFGLGLLLLGAGWNAALVAGSTLLAAAVAPAERPRLEGIGELGMGVAAAGATAFAGPLVGIGGYGALAFTGAVAALALVPLLRYASARPSSAACAATRSAKPAKSRA